MRPVRSSVLGMCLLAALLLGVSGPALAQATATNVQDGQNSSRTNQSGNASVGQAITGQVVAVSSGGGASVNASNNTDNSTAQTGDATAHNSAQTFAGQRVSDVHAAGSPATLTASNTQRGDNSNTVSQSANASTGDGIAGQVIGVVTTGGPSRIIASNTTTNSDVFTGDATTDNSADAFAGQSIDGLSSIDSSTACLFGVSCFAAAASTLTATNAQTGNNSARARQSSNASTGDGIAGQVIGAVTSGGSSDIEASNVSRDVGVFTGDADSQNHATVFAGQKISDVTATSTALGCIAGCGALAISTATVAASNAQIGDNSSTASQASHASTGDGVAGQVIGAVTSGGSSRIDARNESTNADVSTGDADASNHATTLAGLEINDVSATALAAGCLSLCLALTNSTATVSVTNDQIGDNTSRPRQAASASTGDGVAGQVIGAVTSGGSSAIAASNTSQDVDVSTGDSDAHNSATAFAGQDIRDVTSTAVAVGCLFGCLAEGFATATVAASNVQTGDNVARASQAANASTGEGVAGQVIGAVTQGGGTLVDATNRTENASVDTGSADASNSSNTFAGLDIAAPSAVALGFGCLGFCVPVPAFGATSTSATNNQTGDNTHSASQAANASSGDAVGGQVVGAISTGGPTLVHVANTTTGTNTQSGAANEDNSDNSFVGLAISGTVFLF